MFILWAGTDDSFDDYQATVSKFEAMSPSDFPDNEAIASTTSPERLPRLLSIYGKVAVISLHGVMTDRDSWYNEFAGLTAYSEIREAVVTALSLDDVSEIVLYTKSPGGVVSGLQDTYEFIAKAAKIKPITMYSDSMVCSAAAWITAPAKYKFISADATAGSIGVIMKHIEYSAQMKSEGVKATVIRAGKFKQLANSIEPLSKAAEADLQDKADHVYSVFVQAMADAYGVTYQAVDKKMADGKTFIGSQAVDVGLIDAISNFDTVVETIQKRVSTRSNGGVDMKKRYAITAESLAALSAGAKVEDLGLEALEDGAEAKDETETEAKDETSADAGDGTEAEAKDETSAEAKDETSVEAKDETETEAKDETEANDTSVVDLLKSQLKAKEDELFDAKVSLKTAEDASSAFSKVEDSLKTIVAEYVNNMNIALGMAANEDLVKAESSTIVDQYKAVHEPFIKSFKVGGVAKATEEEDEKSAPTISRIHQAGLRAVK